MAKAKTRQSIRQVGAWILYAASIVSGLMLWAIIYKLYQTPTFDGPYAEYVSLVMKEARFLFIGWHLLPFSLCVSGRLLMGQSTEVTGKVQNWNITVALFSFVAAAIILAFG